jgi:hypothetical protein
MSTLTSKNTGQVCAKGVRFTNGVLHVRLDDGREISLPLDEVPWLKWLANSSVKVLKPRQAMRLILFRDRIW